MRCDYQAKYLPDLKKMTPLVVLDAHSTDRDSEPVALFQAVDWDMSHTEMAMLVHCKNRTRRLPDLKMMAPFAVLDVHQLHAEVFA